MYSVIVVFIFLQLCAVGKNYAQVNVDGATDDAAVSLQQNSCDTFSLI